MRPRVLVVDDEAGVRTLVAGILEDLYDVTSEADPTRALERVLAGEADLVVTDVRMPGMDGIELLRRVRAGAPGIPVIIMTGYQTQENIIGSFREGARTFIRKPFEAEDLVKAVRTALEVPQEDPEVRSPHRLEVTTPASGWVEITAPNHDSYLDRFQAFCARLYESNLDEKTCRDVRMAIDELGRNAVEWGNRNDINRRLRIAYCVFDDRIVFKIEDEGEGFDLGAVPDPTKDPWGVVEQREKAGKRPGGYGLVLVRKIMDKVYHNARGNMVILEKRIPPRGPAEPHATAS
ncbi:MAG: response regulator [Planctomycetes bacterium]|nr:response regulator [Planctomycetota bacterium]